ncbi:regulatory LuxR family protein [Salana multivorans]|uniref:Regulatory LuxR family protein n=1 Tax=Salana multivorans TaxID=120377 RepID=A0A3N2D8S8_9MICO|nr:regulatory LuxR family protein [Salana multivorans]
MVREKLEGTVLTDRQLTVVRRAADGWTTAAIARAVGISPETVARDLAHAAERVGAKNRTHLVARLYELGILGARQARPSGEVKPIENARRRPTSSHATP